ncbi:small subunit ribosomal protein S4 [Mycoplasmoides fastidiosum]|uniref:Small ribosomal subunit protein uS4 n=1 Tax=Mycoplasmoides fastidiosum TaxID=92758 RepID=A0ABU0M017_9BACT|nr:30S ribosomal protein S4 [Mycoplasmoides fastidiosum]MDQ0514185.1 small subunit ribosomal protein S4 [Mycoplasmoides fastidiosum]UUD37403.1 30S ribosomal protein S4 [Mycoplasmoides fastidiosum]
MSRYTGSIYRKSRRYGISLLENNKEFSKGKKRTTIPGQHGPAQIRRKKLTGYGEQLQEKQKMAFMYGLNDRQFRRFFKIALQMEGALSLNLFWILESRLDSLVYRMGFAPTRRAARQLVNHGHVLVNGKKATISSMILSLNDEISLKPKASEMKLVKESITNRYPDFVKMDRSAKKGIFLRYPNRDELSPDINEVYVVEWYKRLV